MYMHVPTSLVITDSLDSLSVFVDVSVLTQSSCTPLL